jgi:hypothetical protein
MIFHETSIHFLNAILIAIMVALVCVFTVHTLLRYIKYRNRPALYLTLSYLCYIVALLIFFVAQVEVVISDVENQLYFDLGIFANVFILLGMVLAILLYDQFSKLKRWIKFTSIILGLLFSGFVLSQFFILGFESLRLRISIYIIITFYGFVIYGYLTVLFFQAFRKTEEKKKEIGALVIGNFLWIVHFVLRLIYGIVNIDLIELIANLSMIFIFICYFLGLFLFPKQKRVG